jgi:sigma-B regulation protein RsbQ
MRRYRGCIDAVQRSNVRVSGNLDGQPMVFAHGFGCDQNMWRHVAPAFAEDFRIVLFDVVGMGGSDIASWSAECYSSLDAYADDVIDILDALDLRDVVFVGHSVSSMIGALAAIRAPERFAKLVMVGPSPRYIDDDGYVGGFGRADIEELLASLESNYLGWSNAMAPVIMGNAERPELGSELTASFCRTDPVIASSFARVTFLSDNRAELPSVSVPTLVLQCSDDVIAPDAVGVYVAEQIPQAPLVRLSATGHCPNLSAPGETIAAIRSFV